MDCSRVVAACDTKRVEGGKQGPFKVERKVQQVEPWVDGQNVSSWRHGATQAWQQGPPSSAWREGCAGAVQDSDFLNWLEQKLAAERAAFVTRIEDRVQQHLSDHHKALFEEVSCQVTSTFTDFTAKRRDSAKVALENAKLALEEHDNVLPGGYSGPDVKAMVHNSESAAPKASQASKKQSASAYRSARLRGLALRHMHGLNNETFFEKLVNNNTFELVCCSFIIGNVIVMAMEVQYLGCYSGHAIHHSDCKSRAGDMWPWAADTFSFLAGLFCLFFFGEFVCRVMALRPVYRAMRSGWLWFDLIVLTFGMADTIERIGNVHLIGRVLGGINPTMMRTARVLRMLRMMKVLKPGLFHIYSYDKRSREGFSSLFLLVKSIQASKQALLWSVMILLFTMSCVGMLMNQLLLGYLEDPTVTEEDRREVFEYFGTYTRMITTMFELTLGNWAPPSRLLMDKISQWWGLFVVVYRCVFCFALVNVTNAVFITETNRVAASDDEVMLMRKERATRANTQKLSEIFNELDESGDGCVGWEEFSVLLTDDVMRDFLGTMELEVSDLEELFKLLDDGDGQVQSREFIDGIQTLRGQAKNIDLLTLMKQVRKMNEKLDGMDRGLKRSMAPLSLLAQL